MSTSTETSLQCQDHEEDSKCERKGHISLAKHTKPSLQQQMVFLHIDQHTTQVRVWYKVKNVYKPHPHKLKYRI